MKISVEGRFEAVKRLMSEKPIIGHGDVAQKIGVSKSSAAQILIAMRKKNLVQFRTSDGYGRDGNKVTVYFNAGTSEEDIIRELEIKLNRRGKRVRKSTSTPRHFSDSPFLLGEVWRNIVNTHP
jgi:predicted transcriptional regulator